MDITCSEDIISGSVSSHCAFDILHADVLLMVFSFLTLYERLKAMSVCKKWKSLLKQRTAWSVIDFTEECSNASPVQYVQPIVRGKPTWTFKHPRSEKIVLEFLQQYAGGSLREVYLSFMSDEIMKLLRKNCPHVTTLSCVRVSPKCFNVKNCDVDQNFYIPTGIRRCELRSWPIWTYDGDNKRAKRDNERSKRDEKILSILAQRTQLRYLTLECFILTLDGMKAVTESNNGLQEINLIYPISTSKSDFFGNESMDNILASSVSGLKNLKRLKIVGCGSHSMLSKFLSSFAQGKNLTELCLRLSGSSSSFKSMLPGISNLESLQLEGDRIVTTTTIKTIGVNLKKLKILELANGSYSDDSLRTLLNHPTLEKIWIHQDSQSSLQASWLDAIYDVLVTLPNIKHVRLKGYRILHLHTTGQFPKLEATVKVEIENAEEIVIFD